jgi:dephospho-CoA kinase
MVIGLTGGIGCGKSTAARMFARRGYRRIDCDAIVHDLIAKDPKVRDALMKIFGEGIRASDGSLDRKAIGAIVFEDEHRLEELENILHPRIRDRWESLIGEAPESDWIVEVPLLFEKNLQNRVDFTVCVFSDLSSQVERLGQKGMDRAQALTRINRQMPTEEKAEKADCVLLNEGSLAFLEDQVNQLLTRF